jgi:hypothetical protein
LSADADAVAVTVGDACEEDEDDGEEAEARMRPARGVLLLGRQGDGRFSGSGLVGVLVSVVGDGGALGEAGVVSTATADDAADSGEPAAVSTISPSAIVYSSLLVSCN